MDPASSEPRYQSATKAPPPPPPDETQPPQPDPDACGLGYCKPVLDTAGLEVQNMYMNFYSPGYDGEDAEHGGAKIWGVKRRTFFIALMGAMISISAIGGGAGGGIAATNARKSTVITAIKCNLCPPRLQETPVIRVPLVSR